MEEYRERLRPEATKIARRNLVSPRSSRAENIGSSDEEIEVQIKAMVGSDGGEESEYGRSAPRRWPTCCARVPAAR